jgi:hypothetical protein
MMRIAFILLICFTFLASDGIARKGRSQRRAVRSITEAKEGESARLYAGNGKTYSFVREKSDLESEEAGVMGTMATNSPCDGEAFDGTDRKAAKISLSTAALETYASLDALMQTLPADDVIGKRKPKITTDAASVRVKEEKRNVYVKKAWIYTLAREGDEDFHTIIGNTPRATPATKYFNIEISGLAASGSKSSVRLQKVRNTYKKFFGFDKAACQGGYVANFSKPVAIEFKGSLFFDQLHYEGHTTIGHGDAKPKSYWEVHPVSYIKFL